MKTKTFLVFLFLTLFAVQSCMISSSPKMAFFDDPHYDYKGAEFVSINVPMFLAKPIVKKALRDEGESEDLISIVKKVADIKMMTVTNGNKQILTDFSKYLTKNNFEEWITVKKEKETINFQAKQKGDVIRNLIITIASGNELVLLDISGKFRPDDISKMINYSERQDLVKITRTK